MRQELGWLGKKFLVKEITFNLLFWNIIIIIIIIAIVIVIVIIIIIIILFFSI